MRRHHRPNPGMITITPQVCFLRTAVPWTLLFCMDTLIDPNASNRIECIFEREQ